MLLHVIEDLNEWSCNTLFSIDIIEIFSVNTSRKHAENVGFCRICHKLHTSITNYMNVKPLLH